MMAPVDNRPSPCVTQARHGCACKISPQYVAPFRRYLDPQIYRPAPADVLEFM